MIIALLRGMKLLKVMVRESDDESNGSTCNVNPAMMQKVIGKLCREEGIMLHQAVDEKHIVTRYSSDKIGECCATIEQGMQRFNNNGDVCFEGAGVKYDSIDLKSLVEDQLRNQFPELGDLAFNNDAYQHTWLNRPGLVTRDHT